MTYFEFMKNPPKYIFDGFNIWEHKINGLYGVAGYVKMDRMKNGKFRVNRRQSLIYTANAFLYLKKPSRWHFSVVKNPNEDIVWVTA